MPRLPDRKGGGRGSFYIQICVKTVSAELTADLHKKMSVKGCCELCGRKLCTLEKEVRLL